MQVAKALATSSFLGDDEAEEALTATLRARLAQLPVPPPTGDRNDSDSATVQVSSACCTMVVLQDDHVARC